VNENPVVLVEYDPTWPEQFLSEKALLVREAGSLLTVIEHIGSTSIPDLLAKPTIDIMAGISHLTDNDELLPILKGIGYIYGPGIESEIHERRYYYKDRKVEDRFHLHVVEVTSSFWSKHIAFRDYLRGHPAEAAEYSRLKTRLARDCVTDRKEYTRLKTDFVQKIERMAGITG
jgi:GrpB-like predicted nucleotidyltransferase (UPF0157 family)